MTGNKWLRKSPYSVRETADRLEKIVTSYPTVYLVARLDQKKNAEPFGVRIEEAETLLFQNNALIGKLIRTNTDISFHLPIRAAIWKNREGGVMIRTTDFDALDRDLSLNGADGAMKIIHSLLPAWLDIVVSETPTENVADELPMAQ